MGIETEYGISALAPGTPAVPGGFSNAFIEEELHPMQLSNHVVKAYGASAAGQPAGWDYETETPLRDIRGYEISRAAAHPDQLTDTDLGMANVILTNGARLYVDHAHPEYSSPEVTCALDAVRYDKAGEAVMALAAQRATQSLGRSVRLYKNNTDGKGASYGTHENYLLQRSTPFDRIVTQFTAFLVSRQVIIGAGRVGRGQSSQTSGFSDQPTRGFLRGRGRPGDHPQQADHQHPRRAARGCEQASQIARDHRRRQPVGDLHLSQGGHRFVGTAGHRGRRARQRRTARRAGCGHADGQP